MSLYPTPNPVISRAYCDWLEAQDHDKAFARPTSFRYSGVHGCSRAAAYGLLGDAQTDPMDGPSFAITTMGTLLHEDIQRAVAQVYPDASFEGESQIGDLISGHYDIDLPLADEIVEIKTVGSYKFDQAIGILRKSYKRADPKGPDIAHVIQAGMNARAIRRSNVRIVYISREAISVPLAAKTGLSSIDRFCAEWVIPAEVWGPLVDDEIGRLETIRDTFEQGYLADRLAWDDKSESWVDPDPEGPRPHFMCNGYCSFAHRCRMDGPGLIPIELTERSAS